MSEENWMMAVLSILLVLGCLLARHAAISERKKYLQILKEDEHLTIKLFGPMCKCGHRESMHVPPKYTVSLWCRDKDCKCAEFKEAT
jgi:hypothetical protein